MNVMKRDPEPLPDGSRCSTHSVSSRIHPEPVRLEPSLCCLGTLLGLHAQAIFHSVKDAMDQDGVALYFVEDQIVVDDENSIAKRRELGIVGNTTDEGVGLQRLQTGFDVIEHFSRGPFYS